MSNAAEGFRVQYEPGKNLNPQKEIVITTEDSKNLAAFAKYAPLNLFSTYFNFDEIKLLTPEFKIFKYSKVAPFESFGHEYYYDDNSIMFAMMYYSGSVEIEHVYDQYQYNNLKFQFKPCPEQQRTAGKKVEDFAFKLSDIPFDCRAKLHPGTKDTLVNTLSDCFQNSAIYQYSVFKIEDGLYRLNVTLSTKVPQLRSQGYIDRKITNFLLSIK